MFFIYALHHDSSDEIYVGKATNINRPLAHLSEARSSSSNRPVLEWIRNLRRQHDCCYQVAVLEEFLFPEELDNAEKFYMEYFQSIGMKLLNLIGNIEGTNLGRTLDKSELQRLRNAIDKYSVSVFVRRHISLPTITRAAAGMRMQRGSLLLIRTALAEIELIAAN